MIIVLLFKRISCLYRVTHRYLKYKNTTRPDMADGCKEKLDWEFVKWVLRDGRTKTSRERYESICARYPEKTIVVKNQRQLNRVQRCIDEVLRK